MHKGISRFLTRIKMKVADFSHFLRLGARPENDPSEGRSASARWFEKFTKYPPRKPVALLSTTIEEDKPAAIPFEKEHRLALWIGESSHEGHAFVAESRKLILAMPSVNQMTCGEIAKRLNGICSTTPRYCKWNDALVYHFTRHYMSVRPVFYPEDRSLSDGRAK